MSKANVVVTESHVNALFNQSHIEAIKMGKKTTVVCCMLPNGFVITESSACVDPANYNHEIGKNICFKRIREKIWELEGYLLQQERYDASLETKIKPMYVPEPKQGDGEIEEGIYHESVSEEPTGVSENNSAALEPEVDDK